MLWICSLYFLGFQGKGLVGTCIFHCLGLSIICVGIRFSTFSYFLSLVSETIPRHRDYQAFFPKEKIFYKKVS